MKLHFKVDLICEGVKINCYDHLEDYRIYYLEAVLTRLWLSL